MEAMGATVLALHVIEIREVEPRAPLDAAIDALRDYDWILFTSTYAVQFFIRRLTERGGTPAAMQRLKICAVGPGTAAALAGCGIGTTVMPDEFMAEGIFRALSDYHGGPGGLAGLRILLPRAKEAREILPRDLAAAGARVDVVPCYQNTPGTISAEALQTLRTRPVDLAVFTSSSALNHFLDLAGKEEALRMLRATPVAVLGPITARTAESLAIKAAVIPVENSVPGLLAAIGAWGAGRATAQS